MAAALAVGLLVMELQPAALRAAAPLIANERALIAVALAHRAPDRRRDVPRPRRWIGIGHAAARPSTRFAVRASLAQDARPVVSGVAPLLDRGELLRDGNVDQRGQIAVRNLVAHLGFEARKLGLERGVGSELDLVAIRGKRLYPRGCGRGCECG
ncbi:MAG TPA: hypothetical protein VML75_22720, partial [Kofleriaceae bacterium]|nr:hypothetical protein [Kofleriaceae bacterium]